ncbi:hypothetical protein AAG906_007559 [Vitis piasezkii]
MLGMIHICISFARIKLCGDVFQRMNNKTYCECAMKELVEVILLQGRLQQKFYRVDSIGQLCSRIVTLIAKVVHNVNNWGKSTQVDYVSKWVEAVACKSNDHKVVVHPYHPQTNGQVELANRKLRESSPNMSFAVELEHRAYWAIKKMNFDSDQAGAKRKYDLNELEAYRNESYECLLLLYDSSFTFSRKLRSRWNGPYVVKEVFPYGTVTIQNPRIGNEFKVNGQRLKHFIERFETQEENLHFLDGDVQKG